jgi:hypothetical protein
MMIRFRFSNKGFAGALRRYVRSLLEPKGERPEDKGTVASSPRRAKIKGAFLIGAGTDPDHRGSIEARALFPLARFMTSVIVSALPSCPD